MTEPTPAVDIEAKVQELMATTGQPEDAVRSILGAIDQQSGEPVGTVRQDPVTKAVAHRVLNGGIPQWRVSHPTDGLYYEMAAAKPSWTLLSGPE